MHLPLSNRAGWPTRWVVVLALAAGDASAQASIPGSLSALSGRVVDQSFLPISGVTVSVEDRGRSTTIALRTDSLGLFAARDLPAGEYEVEIALGGFETLREPLLLVGPGVEHEFVLAPARLSETITVVGGSGARTLTRRDSSPASGCVPRRDPTTQSPVGGDLRPPRLLSRELPAFPAHLSDAQTDGAVKVEGRLGADGSLSDVNVVASTHPDLAAAVDAAVRLWTWESPLLNCVPVDVDITLDFQFRATRAPAE